MQKTFLKQSQARQQELLDVAAAAIADTGFYAASITNLCKAMEISNGAFYKYFKNKEALELAVISRGVTLLNELITTPSFNHTNLTFWEKIDSLIEASIFFVEKHPAYLRIYIDLGTYGMRRFSHFHQYAEKLLTEDLRAILEFHQQEGSLSNAININLLTAIFDNQILLFLFSFGSNFYHKRFLAIYNITKENISKREKKAVLIASLKECVNC